VPADVAAALARELPRLSEARAWTVARTAELVARARPSVSHWWLAHLGTRPSGRRRGLAGAVLEPGLERCDIGGHPAAAAVFTWAGVRFLRRFGFEVVLAGRTADDALPLWVVVREPAISPSGAAGA
jgi:hypothetical protein